MAMIRADVFARARCTFSDAEQEMVESVLLGRDVARGLGKALDAVLDVPARLETGCDLFGREIVEHSGRKGVAQKVEIIDKLAATRGEKQPVCPTTPGIVPPLKKTV